jgi:hypothetical protein
MRFGPESPRTFCARFNAAREPGARCMRVQRGPGTSEERRIKRFASFPIATLLRRVFGALNDVGPATPGEPREVVRGFASTRARAENRLRVRA